MSQQIKKILTVLTANGLSDDVSKIMVDAPRQRQTSATAADWTPLNQEDHVPDKNPFLEMSQDQIQKLNAVLSSEQAKEILGETSAHFKLQGPHLKPDFPLATDSSECLDKTIEDSLSFMMNGTNIEMMGNKTGVDFLQVFDSSGVPIHVVGSDLLVEEVEVEMAAEILVEGDLDIEFIERTIKLDHSYCIVPLPPAPEVDSRMSAAQTVPSGEDDLSDGTKNWVLSSPLERSDAVTSPVRRSQRQIEKMEREQLEKIKAENAELQRRELEELQRQKELEDAILAGKLTPPNCPIATGEPDPETTAASLSTPENHDHELLTPEDNVPIVPRVEDSGKPMDALPSMQPLDVPQVPTTKESVGELEAAHHATESLLALSAVPSGQYPGLPPVAPEEAVDPIKPCAEPSPLPFPQLQDYPKQEASSEETRASPQPAQPLSQEATEPKEELGNLPGFESTNSEKMDFGSTNFANADLENHQKSHNSTSDIVPTVTGDDPSAALYNQPQFESVEALVSRMGGECEDSFSVASISQDGGAILTSYAEPRDDEVKDANLSTEESKTPMASPTKPEQPQQLARKERNTDDIFGRVVQRRLSDGLKKDSPFSKDGSSKSDSVRKSYPKRENRKPPGRLIDMFEPALFSKPDRMKKIDSGSRSESAEEDPRHDGGSMDSTKGVSVPDDHVRSVSQEPLPSSSSLVSVDPLPEVVERTEVQAHLEGGEEYVPKIDGHVFTVECEQQDGSLQILEIAGSPVSDEIDKDDVSSLTIIESSEPKAVSEHKEGRRKQQLSGVGAMSPSEGRRRRQTKIGKKMGSTKSVRKDKMQGKRRREKPGKRGKGDEKQTKGPHSEESDSSDSDDGSSSSDSSWCSEDDPDRLWCICKQPHNDRFMINCDGCEDWFHGSCVGITRKLGRELEKTGKEWVCPKCTKAREQNKDGKLETKPVPQVDPRRPKAERPVTKGEGKLPKKPGDPAKLPATPNPGIKVPAAQEAAKKVIAVGPPKLPASPLEKPSQLCLMGCGRNARPNSIFCGNECILRHAHESRKDKEKIQPVTQRRPEPPRNPMEIGRIPVIERRTGRILKGLGAPTEQTLTEWLKRHPTFEVLRTTQHPKATTVSARPITLNSQAVAVPPPLPPQPRAAQSSPPPPPPPPPRPVQSPPPPPPPPRTVQAVPRALQVAPQQPQHRKTIKLISAQPMPVENPAENSKLKAALSRTPSLDKTEERRPSLEQRPESKHPTDVPKPKLFIDPRTARPGLDPKARMLLASQRPKPGADMRTKLVVDTKAKLLEPKGIGKPVLADLKIKSPTELKSKGLSGMDPRTKAVVGDPRTALKSVTEAKVLPQTPPPPPTPPSPEPIRQNVRTTLKEVLVSRIKDTEDAAMSTESIIKIAHHIEDELFKLFNDVGTKYKAKYRSLMFNIKDVRNPGLYRKILRGTILPHKLVRMTPEELASKELAMWREREAKHTLEMIKREQEEQLQQHVAIIKKTHKGEIEIDDDGFSDKPKTKLDSASDPLANMLVDTTDAHRSHLFDLNCKICTGKMLAPSEGEPPPKKARIAKSISLESRSQDEGESDEDVATATTSDTTIEGKIPNESDDDPKAESDVVEKEDRGKTKDKEKNKENDRKKSSKKKEKTKMAKDAEGRTKDSKEKQKSSGSAAAKDRTKEKSAKGNEGEKGREREEESREKTKDVGSKKGKGKDSIANKKTKKVRIQKVNEGGGRDADREPSSTVMISSPDSAEPSQSDDSKAHPSVWKGFITMQDVAKFVTNAYKVSGPTDFLGQDIPDTIQVCGRIAPNTVWDYLSKVKQSGNKEFLVIRFSPANEEEKVSYVSFYSYLSSRNRFGVVGNSSRMIKDFYILPLSAGSPVPATLLPFEGPGLDEVRPHMLLGVIIRHRGKRKVGAKDASGKTTKSKKSALTSNDSLEISNDSSGDALAVDGKLSKRVKFDLSAKSDASTAGDASVPAYEPSYTPPLDDLKKSGSGSVEDGSSPYEPSFTPPLEHASKNRSSGGDDSPYSPGRGHDDDDKPYDPEEAAEEAVKMSKTIIPGLLAGSVSSQSVSELIDQISMSSNPTGITTTVLASIATATNLEQQRQLLIELTQKVEEQKRQLEMQKQQIATKVTAQVMGAMAPFAMSHPEPATSSDVAKSALGSLKMATGGDAAYSPSYTPPLEGGGMDSMMTQPLKLPDTSSISLPPNLQEILESIKKQGSSAPAAISSVSGVANIPVPSDPVTMNPLMEDPIVKNFSVIEELGDGNADDIHVEKSDRLEEPLQGLADAEPAVVEDADRSVPSPPPKQSDPRLKRKDPRLKVPETVTSKSTLGSLSASELMAIALKQFEDLPSVPAESQSSDTITTVIEAGSNKGSVPAVPARDPNLPFESVTIIKPQASRKITLNIPSEIRKELLPPGVEDVVEESGNAPAPPPDAATAAMLQAAQSVPQMVAYPIPPPPFMPGVVPPAAFAGPPPGFGMPRPMFTPFATAPAFPPPPPQVAVGGNFWPAPNNSRGCGAVGNQSQQDWRSGGPRFRGRGRGRWQGGGQRGNWDNHGGFHQGGNGGEWSGQDKDERKEWHRDRDDRDERDHHRGGADGRNRDRGRRWDRDWGRRGNRRDRSGSRERDDRRSRDRRERSRSSSSSERDDKRDRSRRDRERSSSSSSDRDRDERREDRDKDRTRHRDKK